MSFEDNLADETVVLVAGAASTAILNLSIIIITAEWKRKLAKAQAA